MKESTMAGVAARDKTNRVIANRDDMVRNMELPGGKNLRVVSIKNTPLFGLVYTGGGPVPDQLSGRWTSGPRAEEAGRAYIRQCLDEYIEQRTT